MYSWNRNIVAKLATEKDLFLFSESNQNHVVSSVAEHVFGYINGAHGERYKKSSSEHIFCIDQLLQELLHNNYIAECLEGDNVKENVIGNNYASLTTEHLSEEVIDSLSDLTNRLQLHIFLVDDFLDPKISSLELLKPEQDTLLIKPFGHYPAISPIFSKDKACYHCFADRMLANQPIRKWWQLNKQESLFIPAKRETSQDIELFFQKLSSINFDALIIFDKSYQKVSEHSFRLDPSCPHCGESELYSGQLSEPVVVRSQLKNNYRDGGFRTEEPENTLAKLLELVDPVTGHICNSHTQKQVSKDKNVIFFSSFYTQPYNTNDFKPEKFIYTTMGKGISHKQSQISALSEAVERIASQYQGDEPKQYSRESDLAGRFVSVKELTPFSPGQYETFQESLHSQDLNQIHQCEPYRDEAIYWTHGWSLFSQEKVILPFNFCYANTPFEDKFTNFFHNGGSAGNCIEEAILQGIFELIERDAVAIWWYNKLGCPRVDFSAVSPLLLRQIEEQLSPEYDVWVLDLTQDIKVPVMCAVSQHRVSGEFALGFGCHLDSTISCQRALTELFQLIEIKDNNTSPFQLSQINAEAYLYGDQNNLHKLMPSELLSSDLKDDIDYCLAELKKIDLDIIVINNSRAVLGLSSVKVIIPGLCHIFPYFGLDRLYQVPVDMGYFEQPKQEAELNFLELLI